MRSHSARREHQCAYVLVAAFLISVAACSAPPPVIDPPDESVFTPPIQTDGPTISVYVDGTESMRGFVTPPANQGPTTYQDLLPTTVDDAIQQLWPSAPKNYFRFGTDVVSLEPDPLGVIQDWLAVPTVPFYTDVSVLYNTYIQRAIDHVSDADLKIIVTDLYQANAEVGTLLSSLSAQAFEVGNTVGITAVRSEFNGTVFTEALGSNPRMYTYRSYQSDCGVACMRPFYFLAIGRHADVAAFHAQLRERAARNIRDGQLHQVHVTADRAEGLMNLAGSTVTTPSFNPELVDNVMFSSPLPLQERSYREFTRHAGEVAEVTLRLASPIEHWAEGNPLLPTVTLLVEEWQLTAAGGGQFVAGNLSGTMARPGVEEHEIVVEIPVGALDRPGTAYRVTIDIERNAASLAADPWAAEWNVEPGAQGEDVVGPRTMNLERLIDGLWSALRAERIPPVAKIRLYFWAR